MHVRVIRHSDISDSNSIDFHSDSDSIYIITISTFTWACLMKHFKPVRDNVRGMNGNQLWLFVSAWVQTFKCDEL